MLYGSLEEDTAKCTYNTPRENMEQFSINRGRYAKTSPRILKNSPLK